MFSVKLQVLLNNIELYEHTTTGPIWLEVLAQSFANYSQIPSFCLQAVGCTVASTDFYSYQGRPFHSGGALASNFQRCYEVSPSDLLPPALSTRYSKRYQVCEGQRTRGEVCVQGAAGEALSTNRMDSAQLPWPEVHTSMGVYMLYPLVFRREHPENVSRSVNVLIFLINFSSLCWFKWIILLKQ